MRYNILYRGPLSSCNYDCSYCPFAKRDESKAELERDRLALERFVDWAKQQSGHRLGILFTPWGEALVRRWYQHALVELTRQPQVERAVIQTNLSCRLDWVTDCDRAKLALWATYHPTETSIDSFVTKVAKLIDAGIRLSVGVVGLREHVEAVEQLRRALPSSVYIWVNAFKRESEYYTEADIERLLAVDPHFPTNNQRHASLGQSCRAGESSFTVDGDGVMRRCHFVKAPIGNIYAADWEHSLRARTCPNETCGCHIGYVNLNRLQLDRVYGGNLLERIPLDILTEFGR